MANRKKTIFKAAGPEEIIKRRAQWEMEHAEYLKTFEGRGDVTKLSDGSYDVTGDVEDPSSLDFKGLAVKYGKVGRNFACGGTFDSLEGAPRLVGGNFSFHGELESLRGFPEEVRGDVLFINHPIPGERPDARRWVESDIRKVCGRVGGKVIVENHFGI